MLLKSLAAINNIFRIKNTALRMLQKIKTSLYRWIHKYFNKWNQFYKEQAMKFKIKLLSNLNLCYFSVVYVIFIWKNITIQTYLR